MSAIALVRARALALPARLWLATIVLVSIVVRVALAHRIVAPWIMVDELVYSELAKSFAAQGHFLVRGVPSRGYGIVYPILIAPAWRLFGPIPSVYVAAKTINCVIMSLAAIPAYLLARRLLPQGLSLVVATLAVLVPEMLYTGMIMTENAFYPIFVAAALLLVLTLERPTVARQLGLLALLALAYETRAQAVALLAASATAPLVLALIRRERPIRALSPFWLLYAVLGFAAVAAVGETVVRGRSPLTLLGAYYAATKSAYSVSGVAHFFLYHVAGLDLYLGIIPFAALVAIWLTPRREPAALGAFSAASLSITLWLLVEVAAFASQSSVDRIEERNMFYLAPLAFVALLALARDGLVPERGRALLAAAVVAGVLPFFIPFPRFITTPAVSDTFALLPWWWVQDHLITLGQVRYAALGVSLLAAAVFLRAPRRFALALSALVACYLVATTAVVDNGRHGIHVTSLGSLWAGTHEAHPDWIDRLVGQKASVSVLWDGPPSLDYTVWEDEFFNRSVGRVYDLDGYWEPDPLPEVPATASSSGVLLNAGRPIDAHYLLASDSLRLAAPAKLIAADPIGVDLYRIDGPVRLLPPPTITGVYPNTWSGRAVSYSLSDCTGGKLSVLLESDGSLFHTLQTVTAYEDGRVVGIASFSPSVETTLSVPLTAAAGDRCSVRFRVAHTAVPALVEPGSHDHTRYGAHFLSFVYSP